MRRILLIGGLVVVAALAGLLIFRYNTKSHSPESEVTFTDGDLSIKVFYNRPYKRGRNIFGGLVPFGKTWRTGANEPTTFTTSNGLMIGDKMLAPGEYSLWTVPGEQNWQVVFNSTIPRWGIDVLHNGEAARDPETDVLIIDVPVLTTEKEFEQFTISLEKADDMIEMVLAWDKTLVAVPIVVTE